MDVMAGDGQHLLVEVGLGLCEEIGAVGRREFVEVEAFPCAQGRGDEVVVVGALVDGLLGIGQPARLDGRDILLEIGDSPVAGMTVVAVGRRTESDIWDVMPVAAVVAAAKGRRAVPGFVVVCQSGKVADLVVLIACRCEAVDERVVHVDAQLLVDLADLTLFQHTVERCALLVHQSIGGDMLGL